ncbi:MAG: glycosyltransferase [Chitinophagales bacterium]|nr:glycosyltransferase [Bacteroidota bacterium]
MELSIVIPLYHSAKNTYRHLPNILTTLRNKYKAFEIIFIIDNNYISKDILPILETEKNNPEIKIYQLQKNYGQHFATLCGFYLAQGEHILSVDEDMSHYLLELSKTDEYKKYDIYYFYYDKDMMYNSTIRRVLSNSFKKALSFIIRVKPSSTFRIITASLRDKILSRKHIFWNIDIMLINFTDNIGGQEIDAADVTDHDSSYNYKRLFRMAFEIVYEHNTIFMNLFFALIPSILYYLRFHDRMRTTVVYIFFAILITLFFNLMKWLSPSTKSKFEAAIMK